jgi:hypothetical protein
MEHVIDLELWSRPKTATTPADGKRIAESCRAITRLPDDVVLGLSFVPDATDVINVCRLILDGDATVEEFNSFCVESGLSPDQQNVQSAACFFAYACGQPLAWLHFPATPDGREMAKSLVAWAKQEALVVTWGQGEPPLSEEEILQLWNH